MSDSFDAKGLVEFDKRLTQALRKSPTLFDEALYMAAKAHARNVAKFVPRRSGDYQDALLGRKGKYKLAIYHKGPDAVEVGTDVFYANMVETGHKQVYRAPWRHLAKGSRRPRKKVVGTVGGKHYWRAGEQITASVTMPRIGRYYMKKVAREAGFDVKG